MLTAMETAWCQPWKRGVVAPDFGYRDEPKRSTIILCSIAVRELIRQGAIVGRRDAAAGCSSPWLCAFWRWVPAPRPSVPGPGTPRGRTRHAGPSNRRSRTRRPISPSGSITTPIWWTPSGHSSLHSRSSPTRSSGAGSRSSAGATTPTPSPSADSQLVPAADLKAFIARALADPIDPSSSRSLTVFPPGNRPDYCLGRLGVWELPVALPATLDMCATPQGAILRLAGSSGKTLAGSTGETAQQLVNKLWLLLPGHVRAPVLRGSLATDTMLLLFGPVYRNGPEIPATTAARNRLLVGWTVSVFDATQLLRTSLGNRGGLQVQLSHVNLGAKPFVVAQLGNNSTGPLLHAAVTVNGTWRVRFSASARAGGISPFRQAAGILGGGLALEPPRLLPRPRTHPVEDPGAQARRRADEGPSAPCPARPPYRTAQQIADLRPHGADARAEPEDTTAGRPLCSSTSITSRTSTTRSATRSATSFSARREPACKRRSARTTRSDGSAVTSSSCSSNPTSPVPARN